MPVTLFQGLELAVPIVICRGSCCSKFYIYTLESVMYGFRNGNCPFTFVSSLVGSLVAGSCCCSWALALTQPRLCKEATLEPRSEIPYNHPAKQIYIATKHNSNSHHAHLPNQEASSQAFHINPRTSSFKELNQCLPTSSYSCRGIFHTQT